MTCSSTESQSQRSGRALNWTDIVVGIKKVDPRNDQRTFWGRALNSRPAKLQHNDCQAVGNSVMFFALSSTDTKFTLAAFFGYLGTGGSFCRRLQSKNKNSDDLLNCPTAKERCCCAHTCHFNVVTNCSSQARI